MLPFTMLFPSLESLPVKMAVPGTEPVSVRFMMTDSRVQLSTVTRVADAALPSCGLLKGGPLCKVQLPQLARQMCITLGGPVGFLSTVAYQLPELLFQCPCQDDVYSPPTRSSWRMPCRRPSNLPRSRLNQRGQSPRSSRRNARRLNLRPRPMATGRSPARRGMSRWRSYWFLRTRSW
jgi:hypothetical protein